MNNMTRNDYEYQLKKFIVENNVDCKHLVFNQSCHSVADAAEAANADISECVKNICFIRDNGQLIVGIVKGEDRASSKRVAKALGIDTIRTATPDEILEKTGFPAGGTPSFGFAAIFLIDEKVLEMKKIFTGGGSDQALVMIDPIVLLTYNNAKVVRIRK